MANPQKAWKAEYAKSARSSCKTCKSIIDKEILRLGKMVHAKQFDGFMPMWNHASCILKKANQIKFIDDVEGIESLRWEDQQRIRKYVEEGGGGGDDGASVSGPPSAKAAKAMEYGIELSQTSRATCKSCSEKIMKGEVRISSKPDGQGPRGLAWHHANCFMDLYPSVQVDKLSGWESLAAPDQAVVHSLVKKVPSTAKTGIKNEGKEDEELQQSSSKAGAKRRKDISGDQKSKVAKSEDVSTSRAASAKNDSELDSKLESQSKELWALKDDLKKHVTTVELRALLEANSQISNGSELDLRDRCADGMVFGALGGCPMCSGSLHYSGGMYRCGGYLSEWSKCSHSTDRKSVV